jgi:hypothetical protein
MSITDIRAWPAAHGSRQIVETARVYAEQRQIQEHNIQDGLKSRRLKTGGNSIMLITTGASTQTLSLHGSAASLKGFDLGIGHALQALGAAHGQSCSQVPRLEDGVDAAVPVDVLSR